MLVPRAVPKEVLPKATIWDTFAVFADVLIPTLAKGAIIRRSSVVALGQRLDLDRRAVRRMQRLRAKYGNVTLMLRTPARAQAIILSPDHVRQVLGATPDPFATASFEKRSALAHFEPKNALISRGAERGERRRFNENVLAVDKPVHPLAASFLGVVAQESEPLLVGALASGTLDWHDFNVVWQRIARRIVLGASARDDHHLTDQLARLRYHANWGFLRPRQHRLRMRFHAGLERHLARAEAGSLASVIAGMPASDIAAPSNQVAQWLFAFDPAGMASFRALALLASHPAQAERAREEVARRGLHGRDDLPFLRACVLESLRLWPTTPLILRETVRETAIDSKVVPAQTGLIVFAPFFHRDNEVLPYADRFLPDLWLSDDPGEGWPLVPFSAGPAACPARHLVPLIAAAMLAGLLERCRLDLGPPLTRNAAEPLPATLDHSALRFTVVPWEVNAAGGSLERRQKTAS